MSGRLAAHKRRLVEAFGGFASEATADRELSTREQEELRETLRALGYIE